MSAREQILARVRTALAPSRGVVPSVPRDYRTADPPGPADRALLDLLVDRLEDYKATVHRVRPSDLAATVADVTTEWRRLVVPAGAPADWTGVLDGVEVVHDEPALPVSELDAVDGVLTGCRVAIAETGTIVLDAGPDQGRRALTLVPDRHLCVVHADQVVRGVPAGLARLEPTRPLTFVSGPSATSDIELERVEGVHGPRTLVVLLVEPAEPAPSG
jgi:L-lactate dehydrogenase complex protein LldG